MVIILNKKVDLTNVPVEELEEHFIKFLSPSNMFLIPKRLGGLGEIPQVIEVMKNFGYMNYEKGFSKKLG